MERSGRGPLPGGGGGTSGGPIPRGLSRIRNEGLPPKFPRPHSPQLKLETIVVDDVLQTAEAAMTPSGGSYGVSSLARCRSSSSSRFHNPGGVTRIPTPMPRKGEDGGKSGAPWCETCSSRLVELKRQAVRLWMPHMARKNSLPYQETEVLSRIEEKLNLPERLRRQLRHDACAVCETSVLFLKQEACRMLQTMEKTQADLNNPGQIGKRSNLPRTTPHFTSAHHRLIRQGSHASTSPQGARPTSSGIPINGTGSSGTNTQRATSQQARSASQQVRGISSQVRSASQHRSTSASASQAYRNGTLRDAQHSMPSQHPRGGAGKRTPNKMMSTTSPGGMLPGARGLDGTDVTSSRPTALVLPSTATPQGQLFSPAESTSSAASSSASLAVSFFARAAQKLSRKKKKGAILPPDPPPFPTNFCDVIRLNPPPAPPCLLRMAGKFQAPGVAKVKVMVRICPMETSHSSFLSLDQRKKQISIYDPTQGHGFTAPSQRRVGSSAPKMFGFDALFSQDDSMAEICSTSLVEIIQAVVNGVDGCIFSYGHARLGKTYTMLGMDDSPQKLGMIPCAISWLFRLINEQKEQTGARFSVRVSAVEVTGKDETLKDLLADVAQSREASGGTAPGVYLREDPISGTQVENQSELRAPSAERAAYYLDAAIASRTIPEVEEDARNSHLLFTLHVYQYRVDKTTAAPAGTPNVAGGRSRLHLIDLGSCSKSKDSNALGLSALGNIILSLLNGQRNLQRNSKLTSLIRDSLGNVSCRTCMIAHISPAVAAYNETLQVVQLAARIHRMKRRKTRFSGTSSDDSSSCDDSVRLGRRVRRGIRMGVLQEGCVYNGPLSDPDYTSSSEQSCDTVIYVGRHGQPLSDHELTDNERPPLSVSAFNRPRPRMGMSGSRSSGDESDTRSPLDAPQSNRAGLNSLIRLPLHSTPVKSNPAVSASLPRKLAAKIESPRQWCVKNNNSEQWIDGPCSSVYPQTSDSSKKPEQWIDGPQLQSQTNQYKVESVPVNERTFSAYQSKPNSHEATSNPHSQTNQQSSSHATHAQRSGGTPQKSSERHELWVDGPSAFYVSPSHEPNPSSSLPRTKQSRLHNKMLTDKEPQHVHHRHKHHKSEASPPVQEKHTSHNDRSRSKPTQEAKKSRLSGDAVIDKPSPATQDNVLSSLKVSHESAAANVAEAGVKMKDTASHGVPERDDETEHIPMVKPFVRDWVEKHSSITTIEGQSPERHSKSHRKHPHRTGPHHEKLSKDDLAYLDSKKTNSPDRFTCSAQSSPRVRHRKKAPPTTAAVPAASMRTMAWVKSVHEATEGDISPVTEGEVKQEKSVSAITESTEKALFKGDEDDGSPAADAEDAPPDYASVVESIESESQMLDFQDETLRVIITPASESVTDDGKSVKSEASHHSDGVKKSWCNRQSIYELHMDDKLETTRNSMLRLAVNSEDDFSWNSGSSAKSKEELEVVRDEKLTDKDSSLSEANPIRVQSYDTKPSRPMCLRRPDGASNPNLCIEEPVGSLLKCSDSSPEVITSVMSYTVAGSTNKGLEAVMERSVEGRSPEGFPDGPDSLKTPTTLTPTSPDLQSCTITSSLRKSKTSPEKPVVPSRSVSKLISPSNSSSACSNIELESPSGANHTFSRDNSPTKSPSSPISSPKKSISPSKSNKESKRKVSKDIESPSKMDKSASKSSSSRSRLPSFVRSRSLSAKKSSSAAKESKMGSRSASRSPSPSKRDKKEKKEKSRKDSKKSDSKLPLSSSMSKSKALDSDSGNDSGIVKNDLKSDKLLSPYHKMTKPRISIHSSSGHGSDASSTFSGLVGNKASGSKASRAEMSSGYESMMRDSEGTNSEHDSSDETCTKNKETTPETPTLKTQRSLSSASTTVFTSVPSSPAHAWVDTRHITPYEGPLELEAYDCGDVERMARRRRDEAEHVTLEHRRRKIAELLTQQEELKLELLQAKGRLMVDSDTWSFDLHVAELVDENDPGHLEALEKETSILEKRVEACKSRIMMVTCFDINV